MVLSTYSALGQASGPAMLGIDFEFQLCRRGQWLAILLGPFGCTVRWLLSKTNYKLKGSWNWLPIGTFAANMLGCLVDYIVGVSLFIGCLQEIIPLEMTGMHS